MVVMFVQLNNWQCLWRACPSGTRPFSFVYCSSICSSWRNIPSSLSLWPGLYLWLFTDCYWSAGWGLSSFLCLTVRNKNVSLTTKVKTFKYITLLFATLCQISPFVSSSYFIVDLRSSATLFALTTDCPFVSASSQSASSRKTTPNNFDTDFMWPEYLIISVPVAYW